MPVLLYQLWAFVAPGLTPTERKTVRPWIPLALVFFALGVDDRLRRPAVRHPVPAQLHRRRRSSGRLAAGPYFDFVTTMFLAFGLVMEFPILLVGLSRVGIVTSQRLRRLAPDGHPRHRDLRRGRDPGGDLVSPFVLGGTMYILFELTILFIRRTGR